MKKVLAIILSLYLGVFAFALCRAGDWSIPVKDNYVSVTNTASVKVATDCELDAVIISAPTAWTGGVTVAATYAGTLFSKTTALTQTNLYKVRNRTVHTTAAGTVFTTNSAERFYLTDDETITLTVVSSSSSTNDIEVLLRLKRF